MVGAGQGSDHGRRDNQYRDYGDEQGNQQGSKGLVRVGRVWCSSNVQGEAVRATFIPHQKWAEVEASDEAIIGIITIYQQPAQPYLIWVPPFLMCLCIMFSTWRDSLASLSLDSSIYPSRGFTCGRLGLQRLYHYSSGI